VIDFVDVLGREGITPESDDEYDPRDHCQGGARARDVDKDKAVVVIEGDWSQGKTLRHKKSRTG
jgi:hypothetical protein